jgi:hypothetical protein
MPESTGDPPIIITGGSVTLDFDPSQLQGGNGHHSNQNKKIKRIEATGGGLNINQDVSDPKVTIKVYYGD